MRRYITENITTLYITPITVILSKKETPQRKKVFLMSLSSLLLSPLVVMECCPVFACAPYRCVHVFTDGELVGSVDQWF